MKSITACAGLLTLCAQIIACTPKAQTAKLNKNSLILEQGEKSVSPRTYSYSTIETHPELRPTIATEAQILELHDEIRTAIHDSGVKNCRSRDDFSQTDFMQRRIEQNNPDCPIESIVFNPAQAESASEGNRILFLEDNTMPISALTTYRKKVLGFYRSRSLTGRYDPWSPKALVTRIGNQIMTEIIGGKPYHVPVEALTPIRNEIASVFKYEVTEGSNANPAYYAHGKTGFELLADLNPQAQFVFAEDPQPPTESLCNLDRDEDFNKLSVSYDRAFLSLAKIFRDHKINYISIAWHVSPDQIALVNSKVCNKTHTPNDLAVTRYVELSTEFIRRLSSMDGVMVVTSNPNYTDHVYDPSNPKDLFTCSTSSNRIRVGYIQVAESGIRPDGDLRPDLLNEDQNRLLSCTDVYINGGMNEDKEDFTYQPGPTPLMLRRDGYRLFPAEIMATSWGTPLVISYLIHRANQIHRETGRFPSPAELKEIVNDRGSKPMIDPLKHDQFELQWPPKN